MGTKQPEAMQLADDLDAEAGRITQYTNRPGDLLRELAATELRRLHAENETLRTLAERLKQEAQIHAQEGRTANATIADIYQCVSGATGEPGNWHGAEPVRRRIAELEALASQAQQVGAAPQWQTIDTAPEGRLAVVFWMDKEDSENPERHDFDFLEDGVWQKHDEHYQHFCAVAPPGTHGPKESAPYTHWMPLTAPHGCAAAPKPAAQALDARWVPLSERYPDPYVSLLLVLDGKHVTTGEYVENLSGFGWEPHDDEADDSKVTHWMPIPAPPAAIAAKQGGANA